MSIRIGDQAPNFKANTTEGPIDFHQWMGNSWAVLFSHPKDFTPVCTTELGYMAKLKPEFDKRGVKVIGLSVDPVDKHAQWANDIKETQGHAPNYPMIGDTDLSISKAYDMLPADLEGSCEGRTPADNQTVRTVFVIGPDKKVKLQLAYPMTTGPQFRRGYPGARLASAHGQAQGVHAGELEAGRGRHHRGIRVGRRGEEDVSGRLESAEAVHPNRPAAEVIDRDGPRELRALPLALPCATAALQSRASRRMNSPRTIAVAPQT